MHGQIKERIELYGDYLFRIAYTYVKDRQVAEEILQDVFWAYFKKSEQFRGEASLKTYLTKMTVHRSYDYLRSWKNKKEYLFGQLFDRGETKSAEQSILEHEKSMEITRAVLSLKVKLREVILLYYYADHTTKEISEILNTPESTIKSRLQKGRRELKGELQHFEWEGGLYDNRETI